MEHVQPFNRPFPWRTAALAASVVALAAGSAVALLHRPERTRPVSDTGRVPERQVATPLRPRSRISVLVLNGNGTSGVAGVTATRLLGRGYRSATAGDAPNEDYATSLVLYRPGWQREAHRLAANEGIQVVSALDGRLPAGSADDQLVLILGAS